jgi:hypothetical protein
MFILLATIVLAMASTPPALKQLTDRDLVAFASKPFTPPEDRIPDTYVLGIHHNTKVIVEFRCGDVCPAYTSRHIHYDVEPGQGCSQIGGRVRTESFVQGIGVVRKEFCVPAILMERSLSPG